MINMETKIIDYLYGEMNEAERVAFEQEMEVNPELKKSVLELSDTRTVISEVQDIEPPNRIVYLNQRKLKPTYYWIAGIAASILFLLTLFNTQLEFQEDALIVRFGKSQEIGDEGLQLLDTSTVNALAKAIVNDYSEAIENRLRNMDSTWQRNLHLKSNEHQHYLDSQLLAINQSQQQKYARIINQIETEQLPAFANLFQQMQLEHQQELEHVVLGLWEEWRDTRNNDLESIGNAFSNIYTDVAKNKQETEALLVGLLGQSGL